MSDWRGRGTPSAGPGREKPRPNPMVLAMGLTALLVASALSGHVDLISAFSPDSMKIDRLLLQKAAIEATVQADQAAVQSAPADPTAIITAPPVATVAPSSTPANGPCEPSGDDRYCLYTVQEGDTLAAIASVFGLEGAGLPGWQLVFESNKVELAGGEDLLVPGWVLRIPTSDAVLHLVLPGDSVTALAVAYDVSSEAITAANGLADPNQVQIGDLLLIPSPNQVPPVELPPPAVVPEEVEEEEGPDATAETPRPETADGEGDPPEDRPEEASSEDPDASSGVESSGESSVESATDPETAEEPADDETAEGDGAEDDAEEGEGTEGQQDAEDSAEGDEGTEEEQGSQATDEAEPSTDAVSNGTSGAAAALDDATSMSWPVVLPLHITNYMTPRHPLGIDFGLGGAVGSPITASAGGTVEFAGGDACCSYGYYVIVDHGNGLKSLYAHLSSIAVAKGEAVARGQALGIAGNTGNSRGVHLHFEVYLDGKRVDPMVYLPR